jgi:hypothetical protein
MSPRAPFVRPAFATFFYGYAIVSTVLCLVAIVAFPAFLSKLVGAELGFLLHSAAGLMIPAVIIHGVCLAAIGYVIELIAKIEWNTRPDEFGVSSHSSSGAVNYPIKQYFYIANGPIHGPFSAPAILDLYRQGKVPSNARLFVEENGQRRPLNNWSEIGT